MFRVAGVVLETVPEESSESASDCAFASTGRAVRAAITNSKSMIRRSFIARFRLGNLRPNPRFAAIIVVSPIPVLRYRGRTLLPPLGVLDLLADRSRSQKNP